MAHHPDIRILISPLVCKEKLDWRQLERLKDALAESDLPIIVDLLDWHAISKNFQSVIAKHYEVLI